MTATNFGVGIVTCDRPEFLKLCIESLPSGIGNIIPLVIVNDGKEKICENLLSERKQAVIINHEKNTGVGIAKNDCINALYNMGVDHIFILEDDIIILNHGVFDEYIKASNASGILHFNYGPGSPFNRKQDFQFDLHNRHLCKQDAEINPKKIIEYPNNVSVALYEHTVAMFSYFHRDVINEVGVHDEQFYNAWEHVDLTYRIAKAGYHPPFWWFADIANSDKFLTEAPNAIDNSSIASKSKEWEINVYGGREKYIKKHGHYPNQPPIASDNIVINQLVLLKRREKLLQLAQNGEVSDVIPDGSQVQKEFDELLRIFKKLKPKNMCEIGSLLGWTLRQFLQNMEPGGTAVSVDLPVRFFTGPQDERVNQQEYGHQFLWKQWAKKSNINLHVLPFSSLDSYTIGMVRSLTPVLDFLFIDGNHMYEAIKHDFEAFGPLVRPGGVIAFHDIAINEEGGGNKFWNEIKNNYEYKEILKSPAGKMGIGVIIK